MNFGSQLQFECPDKCPKHCTYIDDMRLHGQNSICCRCPVMCCSEFDYEGTLMCMVEPENYRDDWAAGWHKFFKNMALW